MKNIYCSQLKTVKNSKTDKIRYFIKKCSVWSRVSKQDYNDRSEESYRSDCFLTQIKGDLIHNSKIVYLYMKLN